MVIKIQPHGMFSWTDFLSKSFRSFKDFFIDRMRGMSPLAQKATLMTSLVMGAVIPIIGGVAAFLSITSLYKMGIYLSLTKDHEEGPKLFSQKSLECTQSAQLLVYFGLKHNGQNLFWKKDLLALVEDLQKYTSILKDLPLQSDPEDIVLDDSRLKNFLQAAHNLSLICLLRDHLSFEMKDLPQHFVDLTQRAENYLRDTPCAEISTLERSSPFVTCIPKQIFSVETLKKLDLRHSSIRWIPADIAKLKKLSALDVSATNLNQIPLEVCHLPCLEEFSCSHTPLKSVPAELFSNESLKTLRLNNNHELREIPNLFERLIKLEFLDLCECSSLGKIPRSVCTNLSPVSYVPGQYSKSVCA